MNTSLDPKRQALSAARHLRSLVENDCLVRADFDRLMRKIEAGLQAEREGPFAAPIPGQFRLIEGDRP